MNFLANKNSKIIKRIIEVTLFFLAIFAGALLNGFIIEIGPKFIKPPVGADFTTEEGLLNSMKLMQPKHFVAPFLAHALGTLLTSVILVMTIKDAQRLIIYLLMGSGMFFLGGAYMVYLLPSPLWFNAVDLIFAYFPMALIPYLIKARKNIVD